MPIDSLVEYDRSNHSRLTKGGSKKARKVKTKDKIRINPGNVGLPAFDDGHHVVHKMGNYNVTALYYLIEFLDNSIIIDHKALSNDYDKAANLAEMNNRKDRAQWIRTLRA